MAILCWPDMDPVGMVVATKPLGHFVVVAKDSRDDLRGPLIEKLSGNIRHILNPAEYEREHASYLAQEFDWVAKVFLSWPESEDVLSAAKLMIDEPQAAN